MSPLLSVCSHHCPVFSSLYTRSPSTMSIFDLVLKRGGGRGGGGGIRAEFDADVPLRFDDGALGLEDGSLGASDAPSDAPSLG